MLLETKLWFFQKNGECFIPKLGSIFYYDLNDILMLYLTYIHLEKILFWSIKLGGGGGGFEAPRKNQSHPRSPTKRNNSTIFDYCIAKHFFNSLCLLLTKKKTSYTALIVDVWKTYDVILRPFYSLFNISLLSN